MNFAFIVPAVLTTGGVLTTSTVVSINYSVQKNADNQKDANKLKQSLEISSKNISDITNIQKLQNENKIADLKKEILNRTEAVKVMNLNTDHSSEIHTIKDYATKSATENYKNKVKTDQPELGQLLKEKLRLINEKDVYTQIQTYFTTTPKIKKDDWKIVTDTSVTTTTAGNPACKLEKVVATTGAGAIPTAIDDTDECRYGWRIMFIDQNKKIKTLLEGDTVLQGKFEALTTVVAP